MEEVKLIPIDKIIPDPGNLRQIFDEQEIQALADNLQEIGQTDPIQVFTRQDGTYDLFDGERRWRAAKIADISSLKAIVIPRPSNEDLLVKKVSRLMQTKTLSFPEEIRALEEGLHALGCYDDPTVWPSAARKLGIPIGVLKERMRVRQLSSKLQESFKQGELDYTIAHTLGRVQDARRQEALAAFIEEGKLSNRFVTTKFIQVALEFPDKSPIEVYETARQRERFRFAEPRKEELSTSTIDKLDTILLEIHRIQGWLEVMSKENVLDELSESKFNARRFWMAVFRLHQMTEAFIKIHFPRYSSEYRETEDFLQPQLYDTKQGRLPPGVSDGN